MPNANITITAQLATKELRRNEVELHARMENLGRDAGNSFTNNFAAQVGRGSNRVGRAMDTATKSTDRLRQAQERYNDSLKSGDIERVIRDTNRLAKAQRDAYTVTDRLAASQRSLHNALSGSGGGGAGGLMVFGRAVGAVASSGPGAIAAVAGIGGGIAQLAGIATSAAQSLWVLPGALGGIAAAVGSVKLATNGMDDVFSNLGDPEKFAEALRKVSPAAADLGLAVQGALPYLKDLQQATQESFFQGTGPMVTGLLNQYLPEVQSLTAGIAGAINQAFSGVADQLMTPDTQASVHEFITNIVSAFQNLGPSLAPLTQALSQIMAAGSGALPGIAQAATDAANAFATFIDNASRSGDLQKWLDEGLTTLSQLGDIIWDVGRILMELVPVGQDVLPSIVTAFDDIANATGPVVDLISAIGPAVDFGADAARLASGDFSVLGDVFKQVGEFGISTFENVRDVLDKMLEPIRAAIDLANRIPGVDIGQIPDIGSAPSGPGATTRSSVDGVHGTDMQSQILLGNNPTAGLPGSPPSRPSPFWGTPDRGGWGAGDPFVKLDRERQELISGGSSGGVGAKTPEGLVPNADQLKRTIERLFPGAQVNADVNRQDAYGEHASGEALDIMVGNNRALGDQINRYLLQNADALGLQYNLWQQRQYDPSGEITPMENRGSPTANHMDHVHARVSPGDPASGNTMPLGAHSYQQGVQGLFNGGPMGSASVTVDGFSSTATNALSDSLKLDNDFGFSRGLGGIIENAIKAIGLGATAMQRSASSIPQGPISAPQIDIAAPNWSADWNRIAQAESGGNWGIDTGNGYSGGLQFSPSSWTAAGGTQYAPAAHLASPYQQALTAENLLKMQGPGAWPNTFVPGSSGPVPTGPGAFGAPGPAMTPAAPASYGGPAPGTAQGWQPSGGGAAGLGGAPMGAISGAVSAAANAFAPGSGAAAQMGMELANRAIGYGGQLAGIGVNGLLETFGLSGSVLGDPSQSWFGRIAAGFAGAGASIPTTAGKTEPPVKQQDAQQGARDGLDGRPSGPTVNIESYVQGPQRSNADAAKALAFQAYSAAAGGR